MVVSDIWLCVRPRVRSNLIKVELLVKFPAGVETAGTGARLAGDWFMVDTRYCM